MRKIRALMLAIFFMVTQFAALYEIPVKAETNTITLGTEGNETLGQVFEHAEQVSYDQVVVMVPSDKEYVINSSMTLPHKKLIFVGNGDDKPSTIVCESDVNLNESLHLNHIDFSCKNSQTLYANGYSFSTDDNVVNTKTNATNRINISGAGNTKSVNISLMGGQWGTIDLGGSQEAVSSSSINATFDLGGNAQVDSLSYEQSYLENVDITIEQDSAKSTSTPTCSILNTESNQTSLADNINLTYKNISAWDNYLPANKVELQQSSVNLINNSRPISLTLRNGSTANCNTQGYELTDVISDNVGETHNTLKVNTYVSMSSLTVNDTHKLVVNDVHNYTEHGQRVIRGASENTIKVSDIHFIGTWETDAQKVNTLSISGASFYVKSVTYVNLHYLDENGNKASVELTIEPGTMYSEIDLSSYTSQYTKPGYTYRGVTLTENSSSCLDETAVVPESGTVNIYAFYEANTYTITFINNEEVVATKSAIYMTYTGAQPQLQQEGYTFDGWFTQKENGMHIEAETLYPFTNDITLYAQFSKTEFTITFDYQGADENNTVKTKSATYTNEIGDLPEPEKKGYTFDGWFFEGSRITKESKYTWKSDIELKAQFTPNLYTVKFSGSKKTIKILQDTKMPTLPVVSKSDAVFVGWYTKAVNGTRVNAGDTFTNGSNITLYPHWITFTASSNVVYVGGNTGNTVAVKLVYDKDDASVTSVKYKTSNVDVGFMTARGYFLGKKKGSVKISITFTYNSGETKTISKMFYVKKAYIQLTKKKSKIKKNRSFVFKAKGYGVKKCSWKVSSRKRASINSRGKFKAKKKGTVTVTVYCGKIKKSTKVKIT